MTGRWEYHGQINAGGSRVRGVPAVGKGGFAFWEGDWLPDPPQVQSEGRVSTHMGWQVGALMSVELVGKHPPSPIGMPQPWHWWKNLLF